MKPLAVVILAAGKGTRMKSSLAKVLHPINGKPMIMYPLEIIESLKPDYIIPVLGHQGKAVEEVIKDLNCDIVFQEEQLGTGHALKCTQKLLNDFSGDILVINGDTPLLSSETLCDLLDKHRRENNTVTLLSAVLENPFGFGRIVRGEDGSLSKIVEEKDASSPEKNIKEINAGIYVFDPKVLFSALDKITAENVQKEYYLPDVVPIILHEGKRVLVKLSSNVEEIIGINTRCDLAKVSEIIRKRILEHWMLEGITIIHPDSVFVNADVSLGRDTVIYPMVILEGKTTIGSGCTIGAGTHIIDSTLANNVLVRSYSELLEADIDDNAVIGPFAHLRPGSMIGKKARVGNFVETKKTKIGDGSKVPHLSYIGDADIGKNVNIGAGTITCNYDGTNKHRTVIEDDVFIGSDTQLVAPVSIKRGSLIAAGSTVTKNVPEDTLAISRTKQENIKKWVLNWKKKKSGK